MQNASMNEVLPIAAISLSSRPLQSSLKSGLHNHLRAGVIARSLQCVLDTESSGRSLMMSIVQCSTVLQTLLSYEMKFGAVYKPFSLCRVVVIVLICTYSQHC